MKTKYRTLETRFGPDTRFEVPAAPFRATETSELDLLKERLLKELLEPAASIEQNILLRRAANDAAALAWATTYPLLFFPDLLEEKAIEALNRYRRQADIRRRSLYLNLEAA